MSSEEDKLCHNVLQLIDREEKISSLDIASKLSVDHQNVVGAIKSIASQAAATTDSFVKLSQQECKTLSLTPEGELFKKNGSHEAQLFNQLLKNTTHNDGIDQQTLLKLLPDASNAKIGFSKAMSSGWIQIDKETKLVRPKVSCIQDIARDLVVSISKLGIHDPNVIDNKTLAELKKRKLIVENTIKYFIVEKDVNFSLVIEKPETDLTVELLQSGAWKERKFKEYNFNSLGVLKNKGHLHPLLKVREQFRQIFLDMGFSEMPTNNYVENSLWNFDTLVVPQAHPARDSQDTFFIGKPELSKKVQDRDFINRTKEAHEGSKGGYWPRGYQYEWSEEESRKNVLRTHTTAVTAKMLYNIGQDYKKNGILKPVKFFSIDRVFRNETLDATHLAEFNQVEGVVLDNGLTLGNLMGILEEFFKKLGISQLRFKPAYNPYTEPSMEIFSFHPGLKKWVEIGNSGVFRPEMLHALGLPEEATAIAWGLSLERPTMIKYQINNIRELVGHKINLQKIYDSPVCLF